MWDMIEGVIVIEFFLVALLSSYASHVDSPWKIFRGRGANGKVQNCELGGVIGVVNR